LVLAGPTERGTEVYSLYVLASHYGTGAAQALMAAVESPRVVWLLEDNARARRFYEKMGFRVGEGRRVSPESGLVEVQMVAP
jgi:GNAT superfamily N-acetyltransferase